MNKSKLWETPSNKKNPWRDWGSFIAWFAIGWGVLELADWLTGDAVARGTIQAFFGGCIGTFIALSIYGRVLHGRREKERQAAMDQFIEDQKADQDKQAKIDKEIIEQLRNEHELSGQEQDRRLKALEAALKHLRGK
tara:strand:- start:523 stop:933 length:411 start_codon:yes stop_codon:yes gene_type:complete